MSVEISQPICTIFGTLLLRFVITAKYSHIIGTLLLSNVRVRFFERIPALVRTLVTAK